MRLLLPSVALVASCATTAGPTCETLHQALEQCDLRAETPTCNDLPPVDQRALMDDLTEGGCEALYEPASRQVRPDACEAYGWECPPPLFPLTEPSVPQGIVVLVDGIDDSPAFGWSPELVEGLSQAVDVSHVTLPGWETTDVRAANLWTQIQTLDNLPIHLVCYAVGGLDCRFLASPGGLMVDDPGGFEEVSGRIASITTIATPHRGTNVADAVLALPPSYWTDLATAGLLGPSGLDEDERQARIEAVLDGLSLDALHGFNAEVTDHPDVLYRSWAGVSWAFDQQLQPSLGDVRSACTKLDGQVQFPRWDNTFDAMTEGLWLTALWAEVAIGASGSRTISPADGMVAVQSAMWTGFQGCVPADHYDVIGRLEDHGADPATGFDALGFLRHVVAGLEQAGL